MESHGIPNAIQVTEEVFQMLHNRYTFTPRGMIDVHGKGELSTYLLESRKGSA